MANKRTKESRNDWETFVLQTLKKKGEVEEDKLIELAHSHARQVLHSNSSEGKITNQLFEAIEHLVKLKRYSASKSTRENPTPTDSVKRTGPVVVIRERGDSREPGYPPTRYGLRSNYPAQSEITVDSDFMKRLAEHVEVNRSHISQIFSVRVGSGDDGANRAGKILRNVSGH